MKHTGSIVRVFLTAALVAAVFNEAGFFTALSVFLIFIALEIQGVINKTLL
jgi:hypothetical protein